MKAERMPPSVFELVCSGPLTGRQFGNSFAIDRYCRRHRTAVGRQLLFAPAADSRHPTSPSASEAFPERLPERTVEAW